MRLTFFIALLVVLLTSCNVVRMKQNSETRKLGKNEIASYTLVSDSLKIKYWKGGDGPVVVFIHGFGGDALMTWEKEMKEFSKNHTVIAPDNLWFGESTSTMKPELSSQREAIEYLLAQLNITKATFIGQSYGGFIAIDVAIHNPSMVEKLVVANCPGTTFNVKELESVCSAFKVKTIEELFILTEPKGVQRLIELSSFSDPKIPKFILKQSYDIYFDYNHEEQFQLLNSLPNEQKRFTDDEILKRIPTLVLWGEKDEIFSYAEGKRFAETIKAKFVSIPNCGHAPQIDDHQAFLLLLKNFILN